MVLFLIVKKLNFNLKYYKINFFFLFFSTYFYSYFILYKLIILTFNVFLHSTRIKSHKINYQKKHININISVLKFNILYIV